MTLKTKERQRKREQESSNESFPETLIDKPPNMAPSAEHTYGPKCRLAPVRHADKDDDMPPVEAQFFYSSLIPIDDPLSTSSIIGGDPKSAKLPLRPLARGDNNALEKAWLGLQNRDDRSEHVDIKKKHKLSPESTTASAEKRALIIQTLALKHWDKHRSGYQPQDLAAPEEDLLANPSACCGLLPLEVAEELEKNFCGLVRTVSSSLNPERVVQDVAKLIAGYRQSAKRSRRTSGIDGLRDLEWTPRSRTGSLSGSGPGRSAPATPQNTKFKFDTRHDGGAHIRRPMDAVRESGGRPRSASQASNHSSSSRHPGGITIPTRHAVDDGISGKPFVRVESVPTHQSPQGPASIPRTESPAPDLPRDNDPDHVETLNDPELDAQKHTEALKEKKHGKDCVDVAVGVSRLHMVTLPSLQMKPIYWSPINDLAVVLRATWFYRYVTLETLSNTPLGVNS